MILQSLQHINSCTFTWLNFWGGDKPIKPVWWKKKKNTKQKKKRVNLVLLNVQSLFHYWCLYISFNYLLFTSSCFSSLVFHRCRCVKAHFFIYFLFIYLFIYWIRLDKINWLWNSGAIPNRDVEVWPTVWSGCTGTTSLKPTWVIISHDIYEIWPTNIHLLPHSRTVLSGFCPVFWKRK